MTLVGLWSPIRTLSDTRRVALDAVHSVRPTTYNEPGFYRRFIELKLITKLGKPHSCLRKSDNRIMRALV